jgi:hypothetical protein
VTHHGRSWLPIDRHPAQHCAVLRGSPSGCRPEWPLHARVEHQHSVIGDWCCDVADGYILSDAEWRASGGRNEVWVNRVWHPVPATALRDTAGGPNPTGRAVVWWSQVGNEIVIHCFASGNEF